MLNCVMDRSAGRCTASLFLSDTRVLPLHASFHLTYFSLILFVSGTILSYHRTLRWDTATEFLAGQVKKKKKKQKI